MVTVNDVNQALPAPDALKKMTIDELRQLAGRIREMIIKQVASSGGHLASNLGVVELTIALLYVFDFPNDQMIFDVGHQCYPWKLLTGRGDRFSTLRKEDGIAGFPKRAESPYDVFETGHSSTSVSAAAGLARAARLQGVECQVIAMIGDGALSGGMAFEALNDVGQHEDNVIIILNDNQMSIDRAVGGLSRHLEKVRLSRRYWKLKSTWEPRLERMGRPGRRISTWLRYLKRKGRSYIAADLNSVFFEQLGFRYYGPVDGHDLFQLIDYFRHIKEIPGPVLLHVSTVKGKGYDFAESEPSEYHGVAPFVIENGACRTSTKCETFSDVFGKEMLALAEKEPRLIAISAAMTSGTGLLAFETTYPNRFFDVGIAEQHAVTLAAGFAAGGLKPVVALYSTFLQRAVDQVIHDVCLQNLPVVFAIDRAGAVGADGPTHQGYYDLAIAKLPPNLTVFAPATKEELSMSLKEAVSLSSPVLIRYPRSEAPAGLFKRDNPYDVISHGAEGDVAILSIGALFEEASDASAILRRKGIATRHLSTLCTKPFDFDGMMEWIETVELLVIVEDGVALGGAAESIAAELKARGFAGQIVCLGHRDLTTGQASRERLLAKEKLDAEGIAETVINIQVETRGHR
ncbi:MAG TPA: 1-deoxy-D-xylulose-5-phosphate synthase [Fastidiosipila sp.]|nr:1-deoxy-D-xylulose-5-phosphate synthase [Fastidiosipila sp.]